MHKLCFDDDFLLKYEGLFKTIQLDVFARHVTTLCKAIGKIKSKRITIYWYVHTTDKNEILVARHLNIESEKLTLENNLSIQFTKVFTEKFPYVTRHKKKELFVSYAIVEHEDEKFDLNKSMFTAFSNVERKLNFDNKIGIFVAKHFIKIAPLILTFFTFILMMRLISIPSDSIQFDTLSFSISYALVINVIAFTLLFLLFWLMQIAMYVIVRLRKKWQMRFEIYNVNHEVKSNAIAFGVIILGIAFILIAILTLFTNKKDFFSDVALPIYLGKTQTPSYLQISFKDLNESKTSNVLYISENAQTTYFLYDYDLNQLIYQNKDLSKSLCMGEEKKAYTESMLPMIYAKTFANQIYRKTRTKDVRLSSKYLPFQETFCFITYPKTIYYKSNKKILILMGKPDSDENNKQYFYYDFATVKKDVLAYKGICDVNNNTDFIKNIMRSEVVKYVPYQENKLDSNEFEEFDLYQYACQRMTSGQVNNK